MDFKGLIKLKASAAAIRSLARRDGRVASPRRDRRNRRPLFGETQ